MKPKDRRVPGRQVGENPKTTPEVRTAIAEMRQAGGSVAEISRVTQLSSSRCTRFLRRVLEQDSPELIAGQTMQRPQLRAFEDVHVQKACPLCDDDSPAWF
jgi:hypothetical protein